MRHGSQGRQHQGGVAGAAAAAPGVCASSPSSSARGRSSSARGRPSSSAAAAALAVREEPREVEQGPPVGVGGLKLQQAASQGLGAWDTLVAILLPQALRNAYQPVVGQYLNLMKLTSVTCSIGLAEITYQARQIESFNSHAFEAFALATLLYLAIGCCLERMLLSRRAA